MQTGRLNADDSLWSAHQEQLCEEDVHELLSECQLTTAGFCRPQQQ